MLRPAKTPSSITLALICAAGVAPCIAPAEAPPVLAQELANVRASGKVMAALWTVRKDRYTLQLVFPYRFNPSKEATERGEVQIAGGGALDPAQVARVQVWLLKADGTQVFPAHGSSPPNPTERNGIRTISYSMNYSFPLEASREAVAVAIHINDDFYIDQLKPLR